MACFIRYFFIVIIIQLFTKNGKPVKDTNIIYNGVVPSGKAPGTKGRELHSTKYYNGHYTRPTLCRYLDNCTIVYMLCIGSSGRQS